MVLFLCRFIKFNLDWSKLAWTDSKIGMDPIGSSIYAPLFLDEVYVNLKI